MNKLIHQVATATKDFVYCSCGFMCHVRTGEIVKHIKEENKKESK